MRQFTDRAGARWDAVPGKESYGTMVLLLSNIASGEVRRVVLKAETALDAELELDHMSDDDLRRQLEYSLPWE